MTPTDDGHDDAGPTDSTVGADPAGHRRDALGYAAALAELEDILAELESGQADIDQLAAQVRRAAELLELCRGRLDTAQAEVTRILVEVDGPPAAAGEPPVTPPPSRGG